MLDFYEPEEVERLAVTAAAGAHRGPQPADLDAGEIEGGRGRTRRMPSSFGSRRSPACASESS